MTITAVDFLRGMLKDVSDIDLNAEKEERLAKYENKEILQEK